MIQKITVCITVILLLFSCSGAVALAASTDEPCPVLQLPLRVGGGSARKYKDISATVNDCYFAVQNAWAETDMTPASQYLSDELFESLQTKLKWMTYRNEKNVLKNIRLLQALPVAAHDDADNSRDFIWFYIKGKMIDYTINTTTQMKTDGNTSAACFVEYWQFMRKEDKWVLHKILQKNEADQIPFAD